MTPQLWGTDLASVVKWVREFVAQRAQEEAVSTTAEETAGLAQVWFGATVPDGWVEVDGSEILIAEAPDLFAVIGFTYNPTPTTGMFELPPAPSSLSAGIWIMRK